MIRFLKKQMRFFIPALFILASGAIVASGDAAPVRDERTLKLEKFFHHYGCPEPHHTVDYIQAADTHKLDYRLLPAISVAESTCGVYEHMNNRWGWNSGKSGFASVKQGIEYITWQLTHHRFYKDKGIDGKLWAYNPYPQYALEIHRLMDQIDE